MTTTPRPKAADRPPAAPGREIAAALDVGTSKVACLIARHDGAGALRIAGVGHQVSRGMRAGGVADMDQAEEAVGAAVEAAERMAGVRIDSAHVAITCGKPTSRIVRAELATPGPDREIGDDLVDRALAEGRKLAHAEDGALLHAMPVGFTLDGQRGIKDPRGMLGERLGVAMHVVTAQPGPLQTLYRVVGRAHLSVAGAAVAPFASGVACLDDEELQLGVTLADLGGGTTSMAVFAEGALVFTDVLPLGGHAITMDIARGLSTPLVQAERMKTLYGSCLPSQTDDRDTISVPQIGDDSGAAQVPRSALTGIIAPRLEEMLEFVRDRLKQSGLDAYAGRRIVLTGGGAQLTGARELAQRILQRPVRIGRPPALPGLPNAVSGPAFAAVAGLLIHATRDAPEAFDAEPARASAASSGFARIRHWLGARR